MKARKRTISSGLRLHFALNGTQTGVITRSPPLFSFFFFEENARRRGEGYKPQPPRFAGFFVLWRVVVPAIRRFKAELIFFFFLPPDAP